MEFVQPENYNIKYLLLILQFIPIALLLPMVSKNFKLFKTIGFSPSLVVLSNVFLLIVGKLEYSQLTIYDLAYDHIIYSILFNIIGSIIGYGIYYLLNNTVKISIESRQKA